jgi:PEP-CTERM motif
VRKIFWALAAATCLTAAPVSAADIVIGAGNGGNSFPFGSGTTSPATYQQVYNKNQFASPIMITAISFLRQSGGTQVNGGLYTLSASTTNAAVDGLSATFADNIGANNTQVFSGSLAPNFDGNRLRFVFSTPFAYNPNAGNLLLNFAISGVSGANPAIFFKADNGDAGGVFSRRHNFGSGFEGFGLQTTFETGGLAGVPEPTTWAMLILGFGVIGGAMRSARRQSVRVTYA